MTSDRERQLAASSGSRKTPRYFRNMIETARYIQTPDPTPNQAEPKRKAIYIGAPACFVLELACRQINEAFGDCFGCYIVGSCLERPDWRDVDIRYIMEDDKFQELFPGTYVQDGLHCWEQDARWLLLTVSISAHLARLTGLPIDFQFQPQSHANKRHTGQRSAVGVTIAKRSA